MTDLLHQYSIPCKSWSKHRLKLETRLDETRRKTSAEWTLYSCVEQCSHSHIFFSRKYSRGGPHCRDYIKQKQRLYKEASEERQKKHQKTNPRQKNYTKASIHNRYSGRFCSLNLCAWRLASSKKELFQESKDGRPLSKMKLFLCFQICQAAMMNISIKTIHILYLLSRLYTAQMFFR